MPLEFTPNKKARLAAVGLTGSTLADLIGLSSTTDNAIIRANGSGGTVQNSSVTIADSGTMTFQNGIDLDANGLGAIFAATTFTFTGSAWTFTGTIFNINATLGGPIYLASYAKTSLPSAATAAGLIYVTNDAGGAVPAFSDGSNWRRVTDRNVIS